MDERAKFPLPIAVVCSLVLILSCLSPQANSTAKQNIAFHSNLIFNSHRANPALLVAESHDDAGSAVIVTEDHHIQYVLEGKMAHSKSLLGSSTKLIPSREGARLIAWQNGTVLALSNGLLVAHSLPELTLLWRYVVPGIPISITREGQFVYTTYNEDHGAHKVVKLAADTGAKLWTSPALLDNANPTAQLETGQPINSTAIQVWFGAQEQCVRIRHHARKVISTCALNNEQWEAASEVMTFVNLTSSSHKPQMDVNNKLVLAMRNNGDLVCLDGESAGVIWERNSIAGGSFIGLALQNQQFVVKTTVTQIQSISTRDGSTTATMDFFAPIVMSTTTGWLFLLENGQVHQVSLHDRTSAWFLPPLSFIPVVLSLVVLWAAIFWSRLESII